MKLKFTKMHGAGNDFVVIDAINQQIYNSQIIFNPALFPQLAANNPVAFFGEFPTIKQSNPACAAVFGQAVTTSALFNSMITCYNTGGETGGRNCAERDHGRAKSSCLHVSPCRGGRLWHSLRRIGVVIRLALFCSAMSFQKAALIGSFRSNPSGSSEENARSTPTSRRMRGICPSSAQSPR